VHRRYLPGFHKIWLLRSVLPIALLSFLAATVIHVLAWPPSRELAGLQLLVISCFVLLAASFGSGWLRQRVRRLAA
jgi:heme/copper-type cytochrome/quinol oxidase subunit 3